MSDDIRKALENALWFLQNGTIANNGERHPYTAWCETVRQLKRILAEPNSTERYKTWEQNGLIQTPNPNHPA